MQKLQLWLTGSLTDSYNVLGETRTHDLWMAPQFIWIIIMRPTL